MTTTIDLDEGRTALVGCLTCHADVIADLRMAQPVRNVRRQPGLSRMRRRPFRMEHSMRGSGIGWMIRDYAESRNGRIRFWQHLYLFLDSCGRKKPLYEAKIDERAKRIYALFKGRGAQCFHPSLWTDRLPLIDRGDGRLPYSTVPAATCRACEFYEPARRRKQYPSCRWYRENNNMPSPLQLYANAAKEAHSIITGETP